MTLISELYSKLRRVGLRAWRLTESRAGTTMPSFLVGTSGTPGWSSNAAFDAGASNAFECNPYWCFYDGTTVAPTPIVYSRVCSLPAFDATTIATASAFRFRVIADLAVTPSVDLELILVIGWNPAAAVWTSTTTRVRTPLSGSYRVQYELEIAKPAYMLTPAIAAASLLTIGFVTNLPTTSFSVSACTVELAGYR